MKAGPSDRRENLHPHVAPLAHPTATGESPSHLPAGLPSGPVWALPVPDRTWCDISPLREHPDSPKKGRAQPRIQDRDLSRCVAAVLIRRESQCQAAKSAEKSQGCPEGRDASPVVAAMQQKTAPDGLKPPRPIAPPRPDRPKPAGSHHVRPSSPHTIDPSAPSRSDCG